MAEYKGVLIYGEVTEGRLDSISLELLGIGRKLADDLGQELGAVLLGSGIGDAAKEAILFGADKVYVVDDPVLKDYQTDSYTAVMEKVCKQLLPDILLLGQTSIGRDLAPRLAFRLGTGVTMDCIELAIDPETKLMVQTKPVYGGNALAVLVCEQTKPQIATIRVKAMEPLARDDSRTGEVISIPAELDPAAIRTKVLDKVKEEVVGIKLEDAKLVVCGGRGIGSAEGFSQLEELAKLLGGAVGATRPPCDSGWVPAHLQVGLTGKIVTPDVYIGVGLSGSSQHIAGISGAKNIIAINRDPEANIFKVAHYGAVGDYKKVVPSFIEKCKELLSG
jgi:electron transfer flavoprotein alpha subunit